MLRNLFESIRKALPSRRPPFTVNYHEDGGVAVVYGVSFEKRLAQCLEDVLESVPAPNYVAMTAEGRRGDRYSITISRMGGTTPADTIQQLRRELDAAYRNNHRRNLELDALHYVWCNGGCSSGVHRWNKEAVSEELVQEAVRNTSRLVSWYRNRQFRHDWDTAPATMQDRYLAMACRVLKLEEAHKLLRGAAMEIVEIEEPKDLL
jgi:hypothetical protein